METRTIVNNTQKSSAILSVNVSVSKNIPVQEENVNKPKITDITAYPASAIWKVGETLKLGDVKQSQNGLYKLKVEKTVVNNYTLYYVNAYNPKFDDIPKLAKNPMLVASDSEGAIFTLQHDGIHSHTGNDISVTGLESNTVYDKGNKMTLLLANLPNKYYRAYNLYDSNGTLLGPIGAPQGIVNSDNYHQNFNSNKNLAYIVFDNTGVFGVDNSKNVIFVDLF